MKLPQIFIPERSLEGKVGDLLKEAEPGPCYAIDDDAEKLFPNFINYLKKEYENLGVYKAQDIPKRCWKITTANHLNKKIALGMITSYSNAHSGSIEYGYKASVRISRKTIELVYREGYKYLNPTQNKYVKRFNPLRYDSEKDIPFP